MAKKKISGLPAGSALNGTELVPIVQTGTTKRITTQDIANLGNSSGVEGSGTIGTLAKFTASSTIGDSLLKETANAIGLTTPNVWGGNARALQISDASIWGISSLNGYASIGGNYYYDGSYKYIKTNKATDYFQYEGEHVWRNAPSGTAGSVFNFITRMTLSDLGNLGLGVTPKTWASGYTALQVSNTSLFGSSALDLNLGANMYLDNVGYKYIANGYATLYNQYQGKHFWSTTGTGTADGAISFTEVMTLNASGNLGLGKTAPLGILHLYKAGATTRVVIDGDAAQNRIITYRTGGVQRFGFYVNNTAESGGNAGSNFAIRAYSDAGTLLSTPISITRSTGDVGIGLANPNYKLSIQGSAGIEASEEYFYFNSTYSIGNNARAKIRAVGSGGGSGYGGDLRFSSRASNNVWNEDVMTISNNSFVGIGTTTPGSKLSIVGLPTSSAGLSAGDIWNDGGTLKIV
jgi:hypothetical protein